MKAVSMGCARASGGIEGRTPSPTRPVAEFCHLRGTLDPYLYIINDPAPLVKVKWQESVRNAHLI